jgi:hypothetical protein
MFPISVTVGEVQDVSSDIFFLSSSFVELIVSVSLSANVRK